MEQQKQLKKRMYSLIRVIILILVLLTGTTLAWFTYTGNSSVNITPVAGTISKGDANLLISSSKGALLTKAVSLFFGADMTVYSLCPLRIWLNFPPPWHTTGTE